MEDVSTYIRPPTIEQWTGKPVSVFANQVCIADGPAIIYREETHPPNFYFAPEQVNMEYLNLIVTPGPVSYCEWKGFASYYDIMIPPENDNGTGYVATFGAWTYLEPFDDYLVLKDYIAFYPSQVTCFVGDEVAENEGGMFGGWVWSEVKLPIEL